MSKRKERVSVRGRRRAYAVTGLVTGALLVFALIQPAYADTSVALGRAGNSVTGASDTQCGDDWSGGDTAADNQGHVYVMWTDYCSNHDFAYLAVSNDGGTTWQPSKTLCSTVSNCSGDGTSTHTWGSLTGQNTEDDEALYVDNTVYPPA